MACDAYSVPSAEAGGCCSTNCGWGLPSPAAPTAMPPVAVAGVLRCVVEAGNAPLDEALDVERAAVNACFNTKDQLEGMRAFLEKRRPVFTGE